MENMLKNTDKLMKIKYLANIFIYKNQSNHIQCHFFHKYTL
jgi:hypothetical protein